MNKKLLLLAIPLFVSTLFFSKIYASLIVNPNTASLEALEQLQDTQAELGRVFERLSSGLQIVSASDDAAGLGMAEKLQESVDSLSKASKNVSDGIALIQTSKESYQEISGILAELKDLAEESGNQSGQNTAQELTNKLRKTLKAVSNRSKKSVFGQKSGRAFSINVTKIIASSIADTNGYFNLRTDRGNKTLDLDAYTETIENNIKLIDDSMKNLIQKIENIDKQANDKLKASEPVEDDLDEFEDEYYNSRPVEGDEEEE